MSWKLRAAAALVAAGLLVGSPARAADLFKLALPPADAPAQTLVLKGDADTVAAHWRGHGHSYHRGFYGGASYGYYHHHYPRYYSYYPRYYSYYPRYAFSFGFSYYQQYTYYAPPAYYYTPPVYYYSTPSYYYSSPYYYSPIGLDVETYSLPGGSVTYSVTRPKADAETLPPPAPKSSYPMPPARDGTYPYDGGPDDPVPLPQGSPKPATTPRFHVQPPDAIPVTWIDESKVKEPAKGKFAYPAYGEEPRRTDFATDRTIIKGEKKGGR